MSEFINYQALKSLRKGPSFRSFAASVKARNLLNPVVAAPLPSAAALVSTSSLEAITAADDVVAIGGGTGVTTTWIACVATGDSRIPDPRLMKSSNMVCWSVFFSPCGIKCHISIRRRLNKYNDE